MKGKEVVLISLPLDDLQTLIIDCVTTCLQQQQPVEITLPQQEDGYISKKEAASLWGCSTSTIDNHARKGNLTRHYIGSSVRFLRSEVLEFARQSSIK